MNPVTYTQTRLGPAARTFNTFRRPDDTGSRPAPTIPTPVRGQADRSGPTATFGLNDFYSSTCHTGNNDKPAYNNTGTHPMAAPALRPRQNLANI